MASGRIRVGLIYKFDSGWIAGTYYVTNLIHSLKLLEDAQKPHLVVLSFDVKGLDLIREINYPYISFKNLNYKPNWLARIINKLSRSIIKRNTFKARYSNSEINIIFPATEIDSLAGIKLKLFWIPDFQYAFLPKYFTPEEIAFREKAAQRHMANGPPLVLSSADALNHFKGIYPQSSSPLFVLNFAVSHPDFSHLEIGAVKHKYGIIGDYYFSPNQFWVHKNQSIIIEAIKLLNSKDEQQIQVVFSGNENDPRHPDYAPSLKREVKIHELSKQITFLGFIDRAEQLLLMKHAIAVIQPSLFEGWSTVIEDAKALGKYIIASDIAVNREQIDSGVSFFDPHNAAMLAKLMQDISDKKPGSSKMESYLENRKKFANDFMKIVNTVISNA